MADEAIATPTPETPAAETTPEAKKTTRAEARAERLRAAEGMLRLEREPPPAKVVDSVPVAAASDVASPASNDAAAPASSEPKPDPRDDEAEHAEAPPRWKWSALARREKRAEKTLSELKQLHGSFKAEQAKFAAERDAVTAAKAELEAARRELQQGDPVKAFEWLTKTAGVDSASAYERLTRERMAQEADPTARDRHTQAEAMRAEWRAELKQRDEAAAKDREQQTQHATAAAHSEGERQLAALVATRAADYPHLANLDPQDLAQLVRDKVREVLASGPSTGTPVTVAARQLDDAIKPAYESWERRVASVRGGARTGPGTSQTPAESGAPKPKAVAPTARTPNGRFAGEAAPRRKPTNEERYIAASKAFRDGSSVKD